MPSSFSWRRVSPSNYAAKRAGKNRIGYCMNDIIFARICYLTITLPAPLLVGPKCLPGPAAVKPLEPCGGRREPAVPPAASPPRLRPLRASKRGGSRPGYFGPCWSLAPFPQGSELIVSVHLDEPIVVYIGRICFPVPQTIITFFLFLLRKWTFDTLPGCITEFPCLFQGEIMIKAGIFTEGKKITEKNVEENLTVGKKASCVIMKK